ncbi:lantibiotic dehydratase family protein [Brevibacillus laterosporus]|uniref:Lantibiotic dehydratase family protein n=1 Tax=Brevibacillus halotolerans TaxID=1507437 RepID=A0ABT4HUU3_9BACL|nr:MULTISPECIES: lantibiotic dehydratase family protein [Brevibacillus]MCR8984838.1 lantibiotic dehydratase family protein [Brevibacillus laterosporus]MCZ0830566.1 lantibiotic dehydratase family protein [Brevibacillus halotolerans]
MSNEQATTIAPYLMVRVAGGTTNHLQNLMLVNTISALAQAFQEEEFLRSSGEHIEQALYQLVPSLANEEQGTLRNLLQLKRSIYNKRYPKLSDLDLQAIINKLSAETAQMLREWIQSVRSRDNALLMANEIFAKEVLQISERLANMMSHPEWKKGLVLASPEYVRSYRIDRIKQWLPTNQYARSSVSYVGRIASKVSPFSTFANVGLTSFQKDTSLPPTQISGASICHLSLAVVSELVFEMAKDEELLGLFSYEKNPSIKWDGAQITWIKMSYTMYNGFAWRNEHIVTKEIPEEQLDTIKCLTGGTYQEIEKRLPYCMNFLDLINEGLFQPVLPFSRNSLSPVMGVIERLKFIDSKKSRRLRRLLQLIDTCVNQMAKSEADKRLRLTTLISRLARRAFLQVQKKNPISLQKSNLIYEDVRYHTPIPPVGELVKQDLIRLGEQLSPYYFRTHVYDLLVDHFIERYGKKGICDDIYDFLYSFYQRKDYGRLLKEAIEKDKKTAEDALAGKRISHTRLASAPPSACAFFQIASSNGITGIQSGDYQIVLNQLNSGQGGLLSRFLPLFDEANGDFATSLKEWVQDMYPSDGEVLYFPVVSDFSNLQKQWGLLKSALRWGTESPTTEEAPDIEVKDLHLSLSENGVFMFFNKYGQPVYPHYLGAVPQHFISGPLGYFLTMFSPWLNAFHLGMGAQLYPPDDLEYYPRIQEDRIVQRRAFWRIPIHLIPLQEKGETDFSYFFRLQKWQRENSFPDEVYIAREQSELSMIAKKRKPMWLHFQSYHSIQTALQTVIDESVLSVTLTEALPSITEHWLENERGEICASEFVSLIKCDFSQI